MKRHLFILVFLLGHLAFAEATTTTEQESTDFRRFSIRPFSGVIAQSYTLTSSGFSAKLPTRLGWIAGLESIYRPSDSPFEFMLRVSQAQVTFDGFTGVTPTEVKFSQQRAQLGGTYAPFYENEGSWMQWFAFGLGYAWQKSSVDLTTPNAVLVPQTIHGVYLQATWRKQWNRFGLDSNLELFLPNSMTESGVTTGARESSLGVDIRLMANYALQENITLSAGASFRMEKYGYTGTGSRGSIDANETYQIISFPVQFRIEF